MDKGSYYEEKAKEYLRIKGYSILSSNYRTRFGEIDIIAKDRNCIAFIEVRGRRCGSLVPPLETIDRRKRSKIEYAAKIFAQGNPATKYRFDVVAIDESDCYLRYTLIKAAFMEGE